jgi:hypothetical protein
MSCARALWILVVGASCSRKAEPTPIRIDNPAGHWRTAGFVEMVTPLLPPTSIDERDRIAVWLKLPDGALIEHGLSLRYPAGTISDRVESQGDRVVDVRGTRFTEDGGERFHVLRREGAALAGYEWPRDNAELERRATELAVELVEPPQRERFRRLNDCASCHVHDRAQATRDDGSRPPRATDSSGLYQMLAVLSDAAPLDRHRAREVNVDSPYLRVDCADGGHVELRDEGERGARRYTCDTGGVPIGHVDIARARAEGDPRAIAVCRARGYLREHMAPDVRASFSAAFAACGW